MATTPPMEIIPGGTGTKLTKAQVADLQLRYGEELVQTTQQGQTYVFRSPSRQEWQRFVSSLQLAQKRGASILVPNEQLLVDTLVYPLGESGEPDGAALRAVFERKPALPMVLADQVAKLAGADDELVGKL